MIADPKDRPTLMARARGFAWFKVQNEFRGGVVNDNDSATCYDFCNNSVQGTREAIAEVAAISDSHVVSRFLLQNRRAGTQD